MTRTAEHPFEVETDLSGTFSRGDDYQPRGYVDDLEASGLYALRWVRDPNRSHGGHYRRVDLLEGLSLEARAIVEANVLAFVGESEAVDALEAA